MLVAGVESSEFAIASFTFNYSQKVRCKEDAATLHGQWASLSDSPETHGKSLTAPTVVMQVSGMTMSGMRLGAFCHFLWKTFHFIILISSSLCNC